MSDYMDSPNNGYILKDGEPVRAIYECEALSAQLKEVEAKLRELMMRIHATDQTLGDMYQIVQPLKDRLDALDAKEKERVFFETDVKDPGCQAVAIRGESTMNISNNDDWCGDSETGFGATVSVTLTRYDAARLRDMLCEWLATPTHNE